MRVPGTAGFEYEFYNYREGDNPWSLLTSENLNKTEALNQRIRVFIAGYDVTPDVESVSISNSIDSGITANITLANPKDKYVITKDDLNYLVYYTRDRSGYMYKTSDINYFHNKDLTPFTLLTDSESGKLVYRREVNDVYNHDGVSTKYSKYADHLFKHMLFLVKWHSGIRKQEGEIIFDYKEPVIIFLQGRYSSFWYFGFTGFIVNFDFRQTYGSDSTISLSCASRRHQLALNTRVVSPGVAQNISGLPNQSFGQDKTANSVFKEEALGKPIEEIVPSMLLNQSSANEVRKYPVFIMNYLKDPMSKFLGWVDFFKGYLSNSENRLDFTVNDPKGVLNLTSIYFSDAIKSLKELFFKIVGLNSYVQQVSSRTSFNTFISDKLLYGYNISTRDVYENIDKYVDKNYFSVNNSINSDGSFVTERSTIDDPLNHVYSTILGDNIYQVYVFTVKPYTTYNVNAILESNLIRMWETDFDYVNCQWRVNKSSAVIGLHPAFHEDFINTFHILPKIYDIVVNHLQKSKRVLSPPKYKRIKITPEPFILNGKEFEFKAASYVFRDKSAAARYLRTVYVKDPNSEGSSDNKLTILEYFKKYGKYIKGIYVLGHGSLEIPPMFDRYGVKLSVKDRIAWFLTNYALTYSVSYKRARVMYHYLFGELQDEENVPDLWLGTKWKETRERPYFLIPASPGYEPYWNRIKEYYDTLYSDLERELAKSNPNFEKLYKKMKSGDYGDPWGNMVVLDWAFYEYVGNSNVTNFMNLRSAINDDKLVDELKSKVKFVGGFGWLYPKPVDYSSMYFESLGLGDPSGEYEKQKFFGLNEFKKLEINSLEDVITDFQNWENLLKGNAYTYSIVNNKITNIKLKDQNKRNENRRVELYFDIDEIQETRLIEAEKAIEGVCIELGDRTPYEKLKEQVFGVPTETSKIVTGLNFHRPRFIVLLPPLYLGNDSPFTFALREFNLDKNEYQSLLNTFDTIVRNLQYKLIETPMGDVIMEPINYDASPWHQNLAALDKIEWGTYSNEQEHVVHSGAFAEVYRELPYINIFPTYMSSFYKPFDEDFKNKFSVSLPVVYIDDSKRDPYNFNSMNLYSSSLNFKSENVYTRIRVVGTPEAIDPKSSAVLQNYMESDLQSLLTIGSISAHSGLNNNLINRKSLIPYGEYIADGFEDLVRNLEIEMVSAKTSVLINTSAIILTNALLEDEIRLGKDNFATTLKNWFKNPGDYYYYPATLGEVIEKYCIPFLKSYAKKLNIKIGDKVDDNVFKVISTIPSLAPLLNYYPIMDIESSGEKANNRFIIYYPLINRGSVDRKLYLKTNFIRTLKPEELVNYPGNNDADKNRKFVDSVIAKWDEGARKVLIHVFIFFIENSDLGRRLLESTRSLLNRSIERRRFNLENAKNKENNQISSFVRERLGMDRPIFTYSDLTMLRYLGAYNPQADYVTLYGYKEYPVINIPYLHSDVDCSVYAMALFNQMLNDLYTYSLDGLPLTPEILVNRTGYFIEHNTINLINSISHNISVNSDMSTSISTSYIRRNVYYKPEGTFNSISLNDTDLGLFVKSYSILDISVDKGVNDFEKILKSFEIADSDISGKTYSAYRKLGYLFESLTERQHQKIVSQKELEKLKSLKERANLSRGSQVRKETVFRIEWINEKYLELTQELDTILNEFYIRYGDYKTAFINFKEAESKYIVLVNDENQFQELRRLLVQDLEEAKELKLHLEYRKAELEEKIAQQDQIIAQIEQEIQNKVNEYGPTYYETQDYLKLIQDKTGFIVYKNSLNDELNVVNNEINNAQTLITDKETALNNFDNSKNNNQQQSEDSASYEAQVKSLANSVLFSAKDVTYAYFRMMEAYKKFVSYYALVYGALPKSISNNPTIYVPLASGKTENSEKIEVYLFTEDLYIFDIYKHSDRYIDFKNNSLNSLYGFYTRWESLIPGSRTYKENKYVEGIKTINDLPNRIKKDLDYDISGLIGEDILDVTENKPLLVALYLNRKKLEDIDNGIYIEDDNENSILVIDTNVIRIGWPLKPSVPPGIFVISGYGPKSLVDGMVSSYHYATDYDSSYSNHLIYAVEDGIIENVIPIDKENPSLTQFNQATGTYEVIPHLKGKKIKNPSISLIGKYSKNKYVYVHVESYVSKGQEVKAGDLIGKSGNYGMSFGPHLHFELYPFDHSNNSLSKYAVDAHEYFLKVFGLSTNSVELKEFKPEDFMKLVKSYVPVKKK